MCTDGTNDRNKKNLFVCFLESFQVTYHVSQVLYPKKHGGCYFTHTPHQRLLGQNASEVIGLHD